MAAEECLSFHSIRFRCARRATLEKPLEISLNQISRAVRPLRYVRFRKASRYAKALFMKLELMNWS